LAVPSTAWTMQKAAHSDRGACMQWSMSVVVECGAGWSVALVGLLLGPLVLSSWFAVALAVSSASIGAASHGLRIVADWEQGCMLARCFPGHTLVDELQVSCMILLSV